MREYTSLIVVAAIVGFMPSVPNPAAAQSRDALSIADNNSVYVDGKSFKIVPGNAGGDASALIQKLDARDLGSGAIIFRSGDKLYLYTAAIPLGQQRFGSDRRDYGSDRYAADPERQGVYINDPEYAQYKLKRTFDDNWIHE